jgi:hypothetical protein
MATREAQNLRIVQFNMPLDVETVGLGGVATAALLLVRFILQKHFDTDDKNRVAFERNTEVVNRNAVAMERLASAVRGLNTHNTRQEERDNEEDGI